MKLFIPAVGFSFLYEGSDTQGDTCILRRKKGRQNTYLYAYARINGERKRLSAKLLNSTADYNKTCELLLCRLIFLCLERLTGISPAWGILTGIRPVKRLNLLLSEGKNRDECFLLLREKYLVREEKLELAYKTAVTQAPFLIPPKGSFSLYVSIPFCPTRCSYCSFVSQSVDSMAGLIPEYLDKLCEEIRIVGKVAERAGLVADTVYFGGGTPTALEAEQLSRLMNKIADSFNLSRLREYTVEAGRADTITAEKLAAIKEICGRAGIKPRISINPQTMNDDVLKTIGRRAYANDVRVAFALARELGFNNINMDLIAGLPGDTLESFMQTLAEIIGLSPENITVHTLSLKRAASLFRSGGAVGEPVGQMISHSVERLLGSGYNPYYLYRQKNTLGNLENVGYAKRGFESLYNIYIMEEVQSVFAVGAGASTKLYNPQSEQLLRSFNHKFPHEYIRKFDELMKRKEEIIKFFSI